MNLTKEEFFTDDYFLNSLIIQLTTKQEEKEVNNFDFSKVNYNDFYKDNAEEIIKNRLKINRNDPYINLIVKEQAKLLDKTPLEDWESRNFINNNNNNNNEKSNEKDITYLR
jgi:hypothetical protein